VVDEKGKIGLPEGDPKYTLRRVWLTRKEENGYYYGLSNKSLWPLCHIVYTRPTFSRQDWELYKVVNKRFCDTVLEEAKGERTIVFIQDYHLALLPRMLKNERPDFTLIHFWHIPWPNREAFRIFPWSEELLDGLLGNDILGFHIQHHCNNFLERVDRGVEARVDYDHFRIFRGGRPTYVRPFPISVDFHQIGLDVTSPEVEKRRRGFLKELGEGILETKIYVGADRIDYTKGIPERLRAFDLMLKRRPELQSKVSLLQLGAPSRTHIEAYRRIEDEIDNLVDEINWQHQNEEWTPIRFLRAHHDYYAVLAAYRMANILMVTSLHDGMNLVAKEFVSARTDNDGVLLLSQYTGAARELPEAILVNPYDADRLADEMYNAFKMSENKRRTRMKRMRIHVRKNNVFQWVHNIFEESEKVLRREEVSR
jgi:trehalose 6-phosphate synthase